MESQYFIACSLTKGSADVIASEIALVNSWIEKSIFKKKKTLGNVTKYQCTLILEPSYYLYKCTMTMYFNTRTILVPIQVYHDRVL
jgi:hypothetical protein